MQPPGDADGLLERLYTLIGARDAAFVADLLRDFLSELPETLRALTDAFARQDWATLRNEAHRLRSGAHALGGVGVAAASAPLEAAAQAGDAPLAGVLLPALLAEADVYMRTAAALLHTLDVDP